MLRGKKDIRKIYQLDTA